ncbi:type I toxin-antitoxin system Ibs family toxin [Escherichia coli]
MMEGFIIVVLLVISFPAY